VGIATGAHVVLVPEEIIDLDAVCGTLKARRKAGKKFSLVVVAEGARLGSLSQETLSQKVDEFGHPRLGGIASFLVEEIGKRTGIEAREVVLGHLLRGGPPSAFDRVFATRLGVTAVDLIKQGKFDVMLALKGNSIVAVPVEKAIKSRTVDPALLAVARDFSQ
jgi:6-phosphofructokinase 1